MTPDRLRVRFLASVLLALAALAACAGEDGAPPRSASSDEALEPSGAASRDHRRELARRPPKGYRLAAYLDCGRARADGRDDGPHVRLTTGEPFTWRGEAGPARARSVFCGEREVVFHLTGLRPGRRYQLGVSWWDFDAAGRIQSVRLSAGEERGERILDRRKLPEFRSRGKPPRELTFGVPSRFVNGAPLRVTVEKDAGPNAVVGEIWLWESVTPDAAVELPRGDAAAVRVVVITGVDYPGHVWKQTAPALAGVIREDPRISVKVVEDPDYLASTDLHGYDVAVLHFMDWEVPAPGPVARENLRQFVAGGRGLFIVHFACGAFQDWPEFRRLAGRVYDPKLPPHDPRGPFRVKVTDPEHPITRGLEPFDTDDELYTCLAGDSPVDVLLAARSRVTGKDHPMGFVFRYGDGRVFHSPLGHDVRAIVHPPVAELFRRAAAWLGGVSVEPAR